jgi:NTP pyrophosphatase (non-canonical NTP hydrolase)
MITLTDLCDNVEELMAAQGWKPGTPERQLAFLICEVGEVAREVLLLPSAHELADTPEAEATRERLGMELFDVIWNACALATFTGVDLETCSARKITMNRSRQWT